MTWRQRLVAWARAATRRRDPRDGFRIDGVLVTGGAFRYADDDRLPGLTNAEIDALPDPPA